MLWTLMAQPSTPTKRRPVVVSVLGVLAIVGALFAFGFFNLLLYLDRVSDGDTFGNLIGIIELLVIVSLALGVLYLFVASALLKVKARGWWLSMIASAISALVGAYWLALVVGVPLYVEPGFGGLYFAFPILFLLLAIVLPISLFFLQGHFGIGARAAA